MTPLHQAVINNDRKGWEDPDLIAQWSQVPDSLGFTALEIAKFLGNREAFKRLGGQLPSVVKFQENGMKTPIKLSLSAVEKSFGLHYLPSLSFSSYDFFKEVIGLCPYILRNRFLASDNYAAAERYKNELNSCEMAPFYIKWINPLLGYGAFADDAISYGTFIGEYTGNVRRLFRKQADQNPYCFHYPTKLWSLKYCTIDALKEGNLLRFINHSNHPNLQPVCLVDRGLLHLIFLANRKISKGEQLTFNYGKDFWENRKEEIL